MHHAESLHQSRGHAYLHSRAQTWTRLEQSVLDMNGDEYLHRIDPVCSLSSCTRTCNGLLGQYLCCSRSSASIFRCACCACNHSGKPVIVHMKPTWRPWPYKDCARHL